MMDFMAGFRKGLKVEGFQVIRFGRDEQKHTKDAKVPKKRRGSHDFRIEISKSR